MVDCTNMLSELSLLICHFSNFVCSLWPYYLFTCIFLYICTVFKLFSVRKSCFSNQNVLLIIAHPDDECMFFAPAIIKLARVNSFHVLCTTKGNYYGQGHSRKEELLDSCKILSIPSSNVEILDNKHFEDNPNKSWNEEELLREISFHISRTSADVVLTFDDHGVSGHPNHITISNVLRKMMKGSPGKTRFFELESVPLLRKYISFFDLPLSLTSNSSLSFVSSITEIFRAQYAMLAHRSQMQWFRYLYIAFSRYMIINTFVEVTDYEKIKAN